MSSTPPDPPGPDSSATRKATRRGQTFRVDPTYRRPTETISEALERITRETHLIHVSGHRFECRPTCTGVEPHVSEYRAADVRPTAEATATRKAHDAPPEES